LSATLHEEISPLGLRSTCIDFGAFRTDILSGGHRSVYDPRIEDYQPVTSAMNGMLESCHQEQRGDPKKGVKVVCDIVRGEGAASGKPWPRSVLLGSDCHESIKQHLEQSLKDIELWKNVTVSTNFEDGSMYNPAAKPSFDA
jgi:hypothetical protein